MSLSDDFALLKQNVKIRYNPGGQHRLDLNAVRFKDKIRDIYPVEGETYDPSAKLTIELAPELDIGTLHIVGGTEIIYSSSEDGYLEMGDLEKRLREKTGCRFCEDEEPDATFLQPMVFPVPVTKLNL